MLDEATPTRFARANETSIRSYCCRVARPSGCDLFRNHIWTLTSSCVAQSSAGAGQSDTRLQVRAECKQSAIAILHYKLTRLPWHVGRSPREFDASSGILSVKRVRIFDEYVGVEQFVRILVGIGCGRFGTAEVNRLLVACNDGVNRRVLPLPKHLKPSLAS